MSNTLVCPKCCGNGYINLFIKNDEGKEKAIAMGLKDIPIIQEMDKACLITLFPDKKLMVRV